MRPAVLFAGILGLFGALQLSTACGNDGSAFDGGNADGTIDGNGNSDGSPFGGDGATTDGSACDPPDMLVVLDHTDSMSAIPNGGKPPNTDAGHATTKWVLACDAVKAVVAPPADQGLRFGLELFPLDPDVVTDAGGTGHCQTLTALLGGTASNNKGCMPGEIPVIPALSTGPQIAGILDPETLRLCVTTPINAALSTAQQALAQIAVPSRKQYVILVTDGGETCVADAQVIATAQAMATAGVQTYIVGFGATDAGAKGVNVSLLNDLACAGMTAKNFATACTKQGSGYVATTPNGAPLFFAAEDGASVQAALASVTTTTCCGCVH